MTSEPNAGDPYRSWDEGDVQTAFRLFRVRAEAGDESAAINLGYFYDVGLGTRRSRDSALRWYLSAVHRGNSAAASNIATVYRDKGSRRLAFRWFKRAAAMGDGDAEVEVGKLLLRGDGAPKRRGLAVAAFRRALSSRHITEAGRAEARDMLRSKRRP